MSELHTHCQCDNCTGEDCGQDNPEEYEREREEERAGGNTHLRTGRNCPLTKPIHNSRLGQHIVQNVRAKRSGG